MNDRTYASRVVAKTLATELIIAVLTLVGVGSAVVIAY